MQKNVMRFIKRAAEFLEKEKIEKLPRGLRGIYVLYNKQENKTNKKIYDLRYVGMSGSGIGGRLYSHKKSKRKTGEWTHFSVFEVWDNVSTQEIAELEGIARHLYRYDPIASKLNIQRGYKRLRKVKVKNKNISEWK